MNNVRYNTLYDRLYNTRDPRTVDSDDVVNTVDFRRKILRFDQTGCDDKPYVQYSIPRYYSEFRPWFHQCFKFPEPQKHCVSEYKEIQHNEPIIEIVDQSKNEISSINHHKIVLLILLIIIIYIAF